MKNFDKFTRIDRKALKNLTGGWGMQQWCSDDNDCDIEADEDYECRDGVCVPVGSEG